MKRQQDIEPYWQDEDDRLCTVEFLPTDDPEGRLSAADIVGYLLGHAQLTNTRVLSLVGDPNASAYEFLFSFSSPAEKNEFRNLVRSNEDMGNDYVIEFTPPTTEETRNARPLATVLRQDALTHAMLIAATLCAVQKMIVLCPNAGRTSFPNASETAHEQRADLFPSGPLILRNLLIP